MEQNAYQKCNRGKNSEEYGIVYVYDEWLCVRMTQGIIQ